MTEFAALSGLLSIVIGLTLLIVFLIMANNIAGIVKVLRRIEMHLVSIKGSAEHLSSNADFRTTGKSVSQLDKMTIEEKARAYDQISKGQK